MRERPILFSAPEVRAVLAGRKTMMRRVVKPVRGYTEFNICRPDLAAEAHDVWWHGEYQTVGCMQACPYGRPGDRLWGRETWGVISHDFDEDGNIVDWIPDRPATPIREMPFGRGYYSGHTIYRADGEAVWASDDDDDGGGDGRSAWMPSIHMPRWASRITLEVTSVRVERLQDVSEEDAMAEGIDLHKADSFARVGMERSAGFAFRDLWISINGDGSWDANPWVWVVEFKEVIQ